MTRRSSLRLALSIGIAVLQIGVADSAPTCESGHCGDLLVYIGTHGSGQKSGAPETVVAHQGIYAARLDRRTGHLLPIGQVAEIERATWLIIHPTLPVLYSVGLAGTDVNAEANLYALAVDPASGQLRQLSRVGAGGTDSTNLDLDTASMTLFSANHGSGDVSALPLMKDGSLGSVVSVAKDFGTGPHPRQSHPQAHGVAVDPSGRFLLSADFGADKIFVYQFNPATRALTPASTAFESVPAGSGPRHLKFHSNGRFLFVDCELTGELRSYRWDAQQGHLQLVQAVSPYAPGFAGERSAGEIVVSRNGRYLYLSLRGDQNSIVVYAVDAHNGKLSEIQRVSSGGKMPWSMAIEPGGHWILVTNEASNSVTVLKVDRATGKLSATNEALEVPKPVTVTFYPN